MTRSMIAALALSPLLAAGAARGEDAQAAAEGHAIALKACAICHVVAADQAEPPQMKPPAPNFTEIARRPYVTEPFLRDFLMKPHGEARALSAMPGFLIPAPQAEAVIAYLLSLEPGP